MQGFNMGRYYPPSTSSPPSFNNSANVSKLQRRTPSGAQTVRFEMPFHVWCTTCPRETIIPQGVRFNAEKKKVGAYLSTPIWGFRMRHTVCGGVLEIRTDPSKGDYVVHEGGKKRDYGEERGVDAGVEEGGEGRFLSAQERDRRREDAFAQLEGKVEEKTLGRERTERIEQLYEARQRDWHDPYAASRRLRTGFRAERKVRARQEEERSAIRDKYGIAAELELLDEDEGDRATARSVEFNLEGEANGYKPLFDKATNRPETKRTAKTEREAASSSHKLQQRLRGNTRAVLDPFRVTKSNVAHVGFKQSLGVRKRNTIRASPEVSLSPGSPARILTKPEAKVIAPLVEYGSDSD